MRATCRRGENKQQMHGPWKSRAGEVCGGSGSGHNTVAQHCGTSVIDRNQGAPCALGWVRRWGGSHHQAASTNRPKAVYSAVNSQGGAS